MKQVKNPTEETVWTGALTMYVSLVREKYINEDTDDPEVLQRLIEHEFGKHYKVTTLEGIINADFNFEDWESMSRKIEFG